VIGLDLGSQAFKAIELTIDGTEPTVTGFAKVELGPETDRAEALGELLGKGSFHTKKVATSMAGQSVVVRYIPMVEMEADELKQAISFESDKYIPFEADDAILDCQRLKNHTAAEGEASGQMSVVLVACQKQVLHNQLDGVVAHGLDPVAVDVDVFALGASYDLSNAAGESGEDVAIALVDIGATRTQINVMRGGETCFSREIGMGASPGDRDRRSRGDQARRGRPRGRGRPRDRAGDRRPRQRAQPEPRLRGEPRGRACGGSAALGWRDHGAWSGPGAGARHGPPGSSLEPARRSADQRVGDRPG
jgi:hypothetical protein